MTIWLKQSTACTIMFGPFVDKSDGVTLKTDATTITDIDHATTGIFLSKNGAAAAIRHQAVTASVADAYGMMKVTLDTTDTGTLGSLDVLFAKAATYLPVHKSFEVVAANIYDSIIGGGDVLDVSAIQFSGQTITAAGGVTMPGTVASTTNITAGTITNATNVTNAVLVQTGTGAGQLSITSGVVASNVTQIDGQVTTGNNATLKLKKLDIQNSGDDAVVIKSTSGNFSALNIAAAGSAATVSIGNSDLGRGIYINTTSGTCVFLQSAGVGLYIRGDGGQAIEIRGTAGPGIKVYSDVDVGALLLGATTGLYALGLSGDGAKLESAGGGGNGLNAVGEGAGKSINAPQDIAASDGDLTVANLQLISPGQLTVKKNVTLPNFPFVMTDTNGSPATGLTVSGQRRIDGGSFGACANSPVELANGWYTIDLDAGDLNGTTIALNFSATGASDTNFTIVTEV